jgi:acid phosphatase class B
VTTEGDNLQHIVKQAAKGSLEQIGNITGRSVTKTDDDVAEIIIKKFKLLKLFICTHNAGLNRIQKEKSHSINGSDEKTGRQMGKLRMTIYFIVAVG